MIKIKPIKCLNKVQQGL